MLPGSSAGRAGGCRKDCSFHEKAWLKNRVNSGKPALRLRRRMVILSQALNHHYSGKVQRLELRLVLSETNSERKRPTPSAPVLGTGDEIVQAW
jgi:hypothetical protein